MSWYIRIFPGRFYIDGIPFYYFEKPQKANIKFINGVASLPAGLDRGMYTIMAVSGYYDGSTNNASGQYLDHVYEDYNYYVGIAGSICWSNIYRRRPNLKLGVPINISLQEGEYSIDFSNRKIYSPLDILLFVLSNTQTFFPF
jgi:hypothetical protein